jgi:hypothetical protein
MITDYFGTEITEGCEVIFATGGKYDQRDFLQGPVRKINPKTLLIEVPSKWSNVHQLNEYRPKPHQVVVVPNHCPYTSES